jgi:hypothetical protein
MLVSCAQSAERPLACFDKRPTCITPAMNNKRSMQSRRWMARDTTQGSASDEHRVEGRGRVGEEGRPRVLVIAGATGVGKSDVAMRIATSGLLPDGPGEIVSADSAQVHAFTTLHHPRLPPLHVTHSTLTTSLSTPPSPHMCFCPPSSLTIPHGMHADSHKLTHARTIVIIIALASSRTLAHDRARS